MEEDARVRKERLRKIVRSLAAAEPVPLPPMADTRAAVVATVKGVARGSLAAWCSYHLAVGFERLYVYFDDPNECANFDDSRIHCTAFDEALMGAWARLGPAAEEWLPQAGSSVQARQALNALHALHLCVADGTIGWLLHIDADELFYTSTQDVRPHFGHLASRGVAALTYANMEALPEKDCEPACRANRAAIPFGEVTLFKRNPRQLPAGASRCAFHYYTNGKSVVRVAPRARPLSVHEWIPGSAAGLSHWYSCLGAGDFVQQWPPCGGAAAPPPPAPPGSNALPAVDAGILHYACCSSHALWLRRRGGVSRYRLRGVVSAPSLFMQTVRLGRPGATHGAASIPEADEDDEAMEWEEEEEEDDDDDGDDEQEGELGGNGQASASWTANDDHDPDVELRRRVVEIFEQQVALRDATEVEHQLATGACVRVLLPAHLFGTREVELS